MPLAHPPPKEGMPHEPVSQPEEVPEDIFDEKVEMSLMLLGELHFGQ